MAGVASRCGGFVTDTAGCTLGVEQLCRACNYHKALNNVAAVQNRFAGFHAEIAT